MAYVKSRNQRHERSRTDEDEFRNWRSPHHKSSADHFHQRGSRSRDHDHQQHSHTRENGDMDKAGNHRTRYRHDRESKPHRWSNDRRAEPKSRKLDVYSSSEFPVLGATSKYTKERNESSFTPDPIRPLGQRHSSTSSTDWASQIQQFEKDKERALRDMMRYKRRLLMSESSDGSNEDQENVKINLNAVPKKEYETDEAVIVRRQKQIAIGKNTLGYDSYLQQVPKYKRVKNKHIATPNKFQKCSRRAWDGLIRQWRLKLHEYDPVGTYKPERIARKELRFSDTTSEATSEASSEPEVRMDIDLNNSISSAISDYLASNESSRPGTPDRASRPDTPSTELKGLTVSDHVNDNYQTGYSDVTTITSKNDVGTPDATLTPTVTPADHEVGGQTQGPQVNPSDLIAALHHAAQVSQPSSCVVPMYPMTFHPNMYAAPPQLTTDLNPHLSTGVPIRSYHCPHDDNTNTNMQKGDIFDNFSLDDCFLSEDDVIG